MKRTHPDLPWGRYADDGLVHCRTEQEAEAVKYSATIRMRRESHLEDCRRAVKAALQARLAECQLELHPTKTKIVYCRDSKRRGQHPSVTFDFLGYCFRPRAVWGTQSGRLFCGFTPAVSSSALKAMREKIRDLHIRRQTQLSLNDIARLTNPLLRGWISYYGRYAPTGLQPILRYVNQTVLAWARRKFKRFGSGKARASRFLQRIVAQRTDLFVHWQLGLIGRFA
jgi:hypothetical protein